MRGWNHSRSLLKARSTRNCNASREKPWNVAVFIAGSLSAVLALADLLGFLGRLSFEDVVSVSITAGGLGRNWYLRHAFSAAPVVVTGLPKRVAFLDDVVLIGDAAYPRAQFPNPFEDLLTTSEKPLRSAQHE